MDRHQARGVLDFAGGTAVHINAGAAGLALALVLGKRVGWKRDPMRPHNLPFVLLGAGLLWFGWFGFNAGSALGANGLAGLAFVNTDVATGGGDARLAARRGHPRQEGHQPRCAPPVRSPDSSPSPRPVARVSPIGAIVLGVIAGVLCALAVGLKYKFGYDDSLDVVGVHLVGGLVGTLLIGLLATNRDARLRRRGPVLRRQTSSQLGKQAVAAVAVLAYSFVLTYIIGKLIDMTIGFRISEEDEVTGIDQVEHLETAYDEAGIIGGSALKTGV